MKRILATLPTYNERDNIGPLMDAILATAPEYEVLVIDDNSPDGTHDYVRERASADHRIHLLHRTTEKGRGTAGLAGFLWARRAAGTQSTPFDAVVEMDADFSHHPRFLPSLVEPVLAGEADIVVGSRLVPGGGETGRSALRTLITAAANTYIRLLLRLPLRDCTSGFRAYSRRAIDVLPFESMPVRGPEIVQEILLQARWKDLRMSERPILFEERLHGQSTLNTHILANSLFFVLKSAFRKPG